MRRFYLFITSLIFSISALAQSTSISGQVKDESGQGLAGVNIIVKGRVIGTITDIDGNFNLTVNENPPFTLVVSFVGYATKDIEITNPSVTSMAITLEESTLLGQEVVVSASRVEEKIMDSPVSIEKMDILQVQNTSADNYYKGLANLKGVDVTSSSINFQIINTRGFNSTGNTRFVQLTDGMDTQAPALNFPIGNLNGPSELDVESVELVPGASSALYGPNAFNGALLVNSKNAFDYQGLSAFVKTGVNHIGSTDPSPHPMWEGAIRYAKSFKNRIAFKINGSYMQALDWYGTDATDRESARTPTGADGKPLYNLSDPNFANVSNPGADRLHYMGDEASINLSIFPLSSSWRTFASTNSPYYNNIFAPGLSALDYANAGDLPSTVVSVTPYKEQDLISYNAKNAKVNSGLYWRINDKMELSTLYNAGFGTSIYTGAQRYSLKNFGISQYRLQLRADNFFVRAYATVENSGDSYITEFLAKRMNDLAVSQANPLFSDVSGYLATYGTQYLRYLYNQGLSPGQINTLPSSEKNAIENGALQYARNSVDQLFHLDPNSAAFQALKQKALQGSIPQGPRFSDNTRLYHSEGQYDFKNEIKFMDLQVGASYKVYDLRSNGTIFDDKDAPITISEFGTYAQTGKWIADRKIRLTASGRYDKNINFKGRFNPRLAALFKLGENTNIRVSYQTGFRIPSTQGQHIDLSILTARLLGGLERYYDKYDLGRKSSTGQNLAFDGFSVDKYSKAVFDGGATQAAIVDPKNTALLKPFEWTPVKPERVQNFELGFKSLINNQLMIDAAYYYNIYNDFITQVRVRIADQLSDGTPNYATILNGTALTKDPSTGVITGNSAQIYTNFSGRVTSQGAVIGLTYSLPRGYTLGGNYNWNVLQHAPSPDQFMSEYNTPEHKTNISFGNRKVTKNLGFNVTYRWQTSFLWQSSFTIPANGMVPAYSTLDAQVSYRLSELKSVLKIGGSNLTNKAYIQSLGGPSIGAIYYISLTFDEMFK